MAVRMHDLFQGLDYLTSRLAQAPADLVQATLPAAANSRNLTPRTAQSSQQHTPTQGSYHEPHSPGLSSSSATAEVAVLRVELARERAATKQALTSLRSKERALEQLSHAAAATQIEVVKLKQQLDDKDCAFQQLGQRFQQVQESSAASSVRDAWCCPFRGLPSI